ncbi:MAG: AgmX/PglI C-terminal domain-containing protein [Deltaproteobacteria bacterium]|nr:AgmX/PglI C-terminal domain-containing protein [Deltaproteobacteria bacterium]
MLRSTLFRAFALVVLTACGANEATSAPPATPPSAGNDTPPPPAATSPAAASTTAPVASAEPAPKPAPPPPPEDKITQIAHGVGAGTGLIGSAVDDADKTISGLQPKFQACYNDGLKKDPKLAGGLVIKTEIKPDGTVANATAQDTQGLNPAVVKCLTDTMKKAKFSPPKAAQLATIEVPLKFGTK